MGNRDEEVAHEQEEEEQEQLVPAEDAEGGDEAAEIEDPIEEMGRTRRISMAARLQEELEQVAVVQAAEADIELASSSSKGMAMGQCSTCLHLPPRSLVHVAHRLRTARSSLRLLQAQEGTLLQQPRRRRHRARSPFRRRKSSSSSPIGSA